MKIKFYYIESSKEPWAKMATELYLKKIKNFNEIVIKPIKTLPLKRSQKKQKIKAEEEFFLKALEKNDYLILFDENGKRYETSIEFSKEIEKIINLNKQNVVFFIGGSYGVSDTVKKRADLKISLSQLTMNHHIALVMALEQIYRAFCIKNAIPYHNI